MVFRNLELVRRIIREASGLDVSYAYDDLVFAEHAIFIIQFDDEHPDKLKCFFQKDCTKDFRDQVSKKLINAALAENQQMEFCGDFIMAQDENNQEIKLKFEYA